MGIHKSCLCDEKDIGFYIECFNVSATINEVINSFGKLRVQRLTVIHASWTALGQLPSASIRSLQLIACGISHVEDNAFFEIEQDLEELVLSNNTLTKVPLLKGLRKLLSLNLNYNQLSEIAEGALEGAANLRHLRIEGNKICALPRNALNETKTSLELLDLSGNCLTKVPAQSLRNSVRLMYLDLSDNNITEVANFELMNLPLLKEFRLSNNRLSNVASMAFMNVPQLQYLYLQDNSLTAIDSSRLSQVFKQLEFIDISYNELTAVPTFKEMPNIRQVRLDGNKISRIETLAFSSSPKLQLISLQNNQISAISRNSFDSLEQMVILLLANNSIRTIERGMLDGMKNLQQLNLKNNSLSVLDNSTFNSVPLLTTLDLSYNGIYRIEREAFASLTKLFWLDLSSNHIATFEKGTFSQKIANILLDGNPLYCDEKMDWFVDYLIRNQVRTFLPYQPEVTCSGPEKFVGVRLKELMIKKANETLNAVSRTLNGNRAQAPVPYPIEAAFPGVVLMVPEVPALESPGSLSRIPIIGGITEALPAMRNIPGLNFIPKLGGQQTGEVSALNGAIEQFSAPLIRVASSGGMPSSSDIEEMIKSIPNLVINVPGLGNVDVSKLPPNVLVHVLRGGQIPGIPKETTDKVVKEFMKRMHTAAEAANSGKPLPDGSRYLPPLDRLPQELVTDVMKGVSLPHLDSYQTNTIREYYTSRLPIAVNSSSDSSEIVGTLNIPPHLLDLMKLLPSNYDLSKIPKEVMESVSRGEIPDFTLLPLDLQRHLLANSQKLVSSFSNRPNVTVEEILKNLPVFERPEVPTFSPYDINEVSSDLTLAEKQANKQNRFQYYTAVLLGLIGAISIAVLSLLCIYMRRKRLDVMNVEVEEDSLVHNLQMPPPKATSSPNPVGNVLHPCQTGTYLGRHSLSNLSQHI